MRSWPLLLGYGSSWLASLVLVTLVTAALVVFAGPQAVAAQSPASPSQQPANTAHSPSLVLHDAPSDAGWGFNQRGITPQDAYERALVLLRSTLAPRREGSSSSSSSSSSSDHLVAPSSYDQAQAEGARPTSPRTSRNTRRPNNLSALTPYWDALTSWSPIGTVLRLLWRLNRFLEGDGPKRASTRRPGWEASGDVHGQHASDDGSGGVSHLHAPRSDASDAWKAWQASRPVMVWPEWEPNGGYDRVVEGPFLASTPGVEAVSKQESVTDRVLAVVGKAAVRALPRSLRLGRKASARRAAEALRRDADRKREEAIALLSWASGFRPEPRSEDGRTTDAPQGAKSVGTDWTLEGRTPLRSQSLSPAELISDALAQAAAAAAAEHARSANSSAELAQQHEAATAAGTGTARRRFAPNADALWVLGTHSLHATHGARPHLARAKACFARLSALTGNASAHARLGWLEGGAWGDNVARLSPDGEEPQAKALVHYSIAARAGDAGAQMSLAYRYHAGIGVSQSCGEALRWYERAAKQAYERYLAGPPGGLTLPYTKLRLSDAAGGVFGPGASAASTGLAAHRPAVQAALHSFPGSGDPASDPRRLEDLLEFYTYHADRGNAGFSLRLAKIWYGGSVWGAGESAGRVRRDFGRARHYALRITADVWPTDSAVVRRGGASGGGVVASPGQRGEDVELKVEPDRLVLACHAAVLLGKMFLRGEGVQTDYGRAWVWFQRAAGHGDAEAYNYIGVMYRDGLGMAKEPRKALEYFQAAATQRPLPSSDGCVNLAKAHLEVGDVKQASHWLELATKTGDPFESYYLLAIINRRMALRGAGNAGGKVGPVGTLSHDRCKAAVAGFKQAAERADWSEPVFARAERAWKNGQRRRALQGWAMAGERGYEAAQNNVAWLMDRDKQRLRLPMLDAPLLRHRSVGDDAKAEAIASHDVAGDMVVDAQGNEGNDRTALIHWTRSAAQGNVDALVKMGDYYFHGLGTAPPSAGSHTWTNATADGDSSTPGADKVKTSGRRGGGVGNGGARPAYERAAACYAAAADRQVSALAYWNMGWMYESGLGVLRPDFHLAKRYYDMASTVNPNEAYLPVLLSLVRLHARALFATLFHRDSSAISLFASYASSAATRAGGGSRGQTDADDDDALGRAGGGDTAGNTPAYTEAEERLAAERNQRHHGRRRRRRGGGGVDADIGDVNLPETYERLGGDAEARGAGTGGRHDGDAAAAAGWGEGQEGDEGEGMWDGELEASIEGALLLVGLTALAALVYARRGVQMRVEREQREARALAEAEAATAAERETRARRDGARRGVARDGRDDDDERRGSAAIPPLGQGDAPHSGGGGGGVAGHGRGGDGAPPFPWPPGEGANAFVPTL